MFSANWWPCPRTSIGGTLLFGIFFPSAACRRLAAAALTVAMHLFSPGRDRTKLLAVAEDRKAAMLMGIRPDRMQALAWGLAAAAPGSRAP